jgi:hypothetical protein
LHCLLHGNLAPPSAAAGGVHLCLLSHHRVYSFRGCVRLCVPSAGDAGFKVRGATYLQDKKKIPASPPMFELVS